MKKGKVCNKDCFHCVHEDCICDEMDAQDYRDARAAEEILNLKTMKQRKISAYNREYYEQNKESIAAKHREYYEQNKEAIAAYQREYREQNKEAIAAKQRGKAIRQFRADHGYTQREFAKLVGISQPSVSLYESGSVPYDPDIILRRFPGFRAYMESAACGEDAPQTARKTITSA